MTIVVDASVVVALLCDGGPDGRWAETLMSKETFMVAPHLMPVEVAAILRRSAGAGEISQEVATLAHEDLVALRVELFPYGPFAARVWELRRNVTTYDASYVALAEVLDAPLATLDRRLAKAPGPRCAFVLPPLVRG